MQQPKDNIICRILSGKLLLEFDKQIYIVVQPTSHLRLCAQAIYNNIYRDVLFEGWLTQKKLHNLLIYYELLDKNYEEKLKLMEKSIESLKMNLFANRLDVVKCKDIRKRLDQLKIKYINVYNVLNSLNQFTAESYAEEARYHYLLVKTLLDIDCNLVWKNENEVDATLLQNIIIEIGKYSISIPDFREIARTEPWSSYWKISHGNPFGSIPVDWTEEQKTLVLFSQMYDNIYQHPECPDDNVISDDDMLDGWLLTIRNEQVKEKEKKKIESKVSKHTKATEMFVPVANEEEAQKIYDMNTPQNKLIVARRAQKIKKEGKVSEANLPDIKTKLFMEAQRLALESVKNKRK